VLLQIYPEATTRDAVLADPQTAPIPDVHKALFRFTERFVRASWEMGPEDLQALRDVGLSEPDVVNWATLGSTQSWFTMSADGGGIPMEAGMTTGPGVGKLREAYEAAPEGLCAPPLSEAVAERSNTGVAWVGTDTESPEYQTAAKAAQQRYGFVPNLYAAVSLQPGYYRRHTLALELLEAPQSATLSARHHAMARAIASQLTRSPYGQVTARALLERRAEPGLWERLSRYPDADLDPVDRVVLDFASKIARNAYKVTEKDAQSFREAGLDDAAYVDVLNTTSIQVSLDRLANVLGVEPDARPILTD
jgi:uncharacterized peroxidase-related enzyme